jgi:uncharacterized protein (DUF2267 family)
MSVSSVDVIERMLHKVNERLKELAIEDLEDAQRILKSHLQLLPAQLTVDDGARLAAQLPIIHRAASSSASVTWRPRNRVATSAARAASSRS